LLLLARTKEEEEGPERVSFANYFLLKKKVQKIGIFRERRGEERDSIL
jgi:hypothetical protein